MAVFRLIFVALNGFDKFQNDFDRKTKMGYRGLLEKHENRKNRKCHYMKKPDIREIRGGAEEIRKNIENLKKLERLEQIGGKRTFWKIMISGKSSTSRKFGRTLK